jgi:hypothetical protein
MSTYYALGKSSTADAIQRAAQNRFEQAAACYSPKHLRLLFIAEAPPAYRVNRFFYFTGLTSGDTLFLEIMKVLYPTETGYNNDHFQPGFSAKLIRQRKPELLRRFQSEGYFLIDGYNQPMPDGADQGVKRGLMRNKLPLLLKRVRSVMGKHEVPIVLIGAVAYSVCAEALRQNGRTIANDEVIIHPSQGGQKQFRSKLSSLLDQLAT